MVFHVAKPSFEIVTIGISKIIGLKSLPSVFSIVFSFSTDKTLDYETLRYCTNEWRMMNRYLLKDFYVLTPYNNVTDDSNWTVYEYYDSCDDSGVIQAFRQAQCELEECIVKIKGVKPNKLYILEDQEENNSVYSVTGDELMNGFKIKLKEKRSSALIFIRRVE